MSYATGYNFKKDGTNDTPPRRHATKETRHQGDTPPRRPHQGDTPPRRHATKEGMTPHSGQALPLPGSRSLLY